MSYAKRHRYRCFREWQGEEGWKVFLGEVGPVLLIINNYNSDNLLNTNYALSSLHPFLI